MKIRTLIVDDERLARQRLRRLLAEHANIEIVAECADGISATEAVREHQPDLLLLDIQMPGADGFEVVEALGTRAFPIVIFVTAFDEHAIRALKLARWIICSSRSRPRGWTKHSLGRRNIWQF